MVKTPYAGLQGIAANVRQVLLLHIHIRLQQVDVQGGQGRRRNTKHLSFPIIYDMSAHAGAVLARLSRTVPGTFASTPT